jgi:hypothetical protein
VIVTHGKRYERGLDAKARAGADPDWILARQVPVDAEVIRTRRTGDA